MVTLDKYTKQGIVKTAQYKKDKIALMNTPANMRMSKNALVDKWKGKITDSDLKKVNPPQMGRAGRPPAPKPVKKATTSTQTKATGTGTTRKAPQKTTKKTTKKTTETQTKNQPKITAFFK